MEKQNYEEKTIERLLRGALVGRSGFEKVDLVRLRTGTRVGSKARRLPNNLDVTNHLLYQLLHLRLLRFLVQHHVEYVSTHDKPKGEQVDSDLLRQYDIVVVSPHVFYCFWELAQENQVPFVVKVGLFVQHP